MTQFQIKQGLSQNINTATPVIGCWYVTTDTHELYFCADGLNIIKVNQIESFDPTEINNKISSLENRMEAVEQYSYNSVVSVATTGDLPSVGRSDIVYIVTSENATYRWANIDGSTHYYCVGRDYNELDYIDCGNASR